MSPIASFRAYRLHARTWRAQSVLRFALIALGLLLPLNLPFAIPSGHDVTLGWSGVPDERGGILVTHTTWIANGAGLVPGDRVLLVNGAMATPDLLTEMREDVTPGAVLTLDISRRGTPLVLTAPLVENSSSLSSYLWYRFALALFAWLIGMTLIIWRGDHADALVLGAAMLFIAPVTLPVEIPVGGWLIGTANVLWQLQGGAYRFFFPALLLHFLVLHASRTGPLRDPRLWVGVYISLLSTLFFISNGFQEPLAWRPPGVEKELRATAGLISELLAVVGSIVVLRRIGGGSNALRWLVLTTLFFLLAGIPSSIAVLSPVASPEVREFLRQFKALLLLLVVGTAALYVFTIDDRGTGRWSLRGRLAASASFMLTGLYAFAVAGAAAIVHSLEPSLGGVESLMFIAIFAAAILFSPVLRWAREMVDRQMFARWADLELRARSFSDRISTELEPQRIVEAVARELPGMLDVTQVHLVLACELLDGWGVGADDSLRCQPQECLLQQASRGRDGDMVFVPVYRPTGDVLALLSFGARLDGRDFEQPEHAVLRSLAQGVAVALRNAESYLKLRDAQRELDEADRAVSLGDLATGLAHEIKNPLASLKMGLYLLGRDGRESEKIRRIERDVRRIDDLVSGLLRFTHAGAGEPRQPVDVPALVQTCIADIQPLADDRGAVLIESYPAAPTHTLGGPNHLRLVVSNLLMNALEAVGNGGTIEVHVRAESDTVAVSVHDNGPGIPPDQQAYIFELNYSTKPRGSGLGLALARRETERLGGTLSVDSTVGEDTVLRLTLPRITIVETSPTTSHTSATTRP